MNKMMTAFKMTVAAMAGFATDHSMVTINDLPLNEIVEVPQFTVTYHLDISSSHKLTADKVQSNIAAVTNSRIDTMLAMRMGSCAYSVTTHVPTTKAPGATTTKVATKTKVVTTTKAATTATTVVATTSGQA